MADGPSDDRNLDELCRSAALGAPIAPAERVYGGLMHRMYRVRTTQGAYALKILAADTLAEPDARARLQRCERIAAAVAAAGLPAVAARSVDGQVLHMAGDVTALIYPWIEGRPLPATSAGSEKAARIGEILGRIHALALALPELPPPSFHSYPVTEWVSLVDEATRRHTPWAESLRAALPDLARWHESLCVAQAALPDRWVVSHADLHQQNVLWSDDRTPWLIDWEWAGWQQPGKEAVVCALEWSGFVEGAADVDAFRAFLESYRREAPLPAEEAVHGLRACYGNWLGWLHLCTGRALEAPDPEARAQGARQVTGTLGTIRRAEAAFPDLDRVCRAT